MWDAISHHPCDLLNPVPKIFIQFCNVRATAFFNSSTSEASMACCTSCFWMCRLKTHAWRIPSTRPTRPYTFNIFSARDSAFSSWSKAAFWSAFMQYGGRSSPQYHNTHDSSKSKLVGRKTPNHGNSVLGGWFLDPTFPLGFFTKRD